MEGGNLKGFLLLGTKEGKEGLLMINDRVKFFNNFMFVLYFRRYHHFYGQIFFDFDCNFCQTLF